MAYNSSGQRHSVYFIQNQNSQNIKIGVAKSPEKRLKALMTGCDSQLKLIQSFDFDDRSDAYAAEHCLHELYADKKVISEWFSSLILDGCPKDKDELMQIIGERLKDFQERKTNKKKRPKRKWPVKAALIRQAFERNGINSDLAICEEIGMEYKKFHFRRMTDIGSMTLNEFWMMQRHGDFTDQEILEIAKEVRE